MLKIKFTFTLRQSYLTLQYAILTDLKYKFVLILYFWTTVHFINDKILYIHYVEQTFTLLRNRSFDLLNTLLFYFLTNLLLKFKYKF